MLDAKQSAGLKNPVPAQALVMSFEPLDAASIPFEDAMRAAGMVKADGAYGLGDLPYSGHNETATLNAAKTGLEDLTEIAATYGKTSAEYSAVLSRVQARLSYVFLDLLSAAIPTLDRRARDESYETIRIDQSSPSQHPTGRPLERSLE